MPNTRYCLALDLVDDPLLIAEYEKLHENIWPPVRESFKEAGIELMELYRIENRLFMIIETNEHFSFERKKEIDENNKVVQEWEALMWKYQKALPSARQGEKWILMKKIFPV